MNSVKMTLLSMSSHSSVDGACAQCLRGHGIDSCRGLRFLVGRSVGQSGFVFTSDWMSKWGQFCLSQPLAQ